MDAGKHSSHNATLLETIASRASSSNLGPMGYEVNTAVFDGPFDLLLHLILKEEVDIHEISLLGIVESYLEEVQKMKNLDLDIATEFLLIAATLIELKTRRLLPGRDDLDIDDELALWEERDLLLARLLDCKTFKDVAAVMSSLSEMARLSVPRRAGPDERFAELMPDLLDGVNALRVHRAFLRAIAPKAPTTIDLFHVAPIRASVADALMELLDLLPALGSISFRDLTDGIDDRIQVVCRFLALLELYKQGRVSLDQADRFGDITITWTAGDDRGFESALVIDNYEG